MSRATLLFAPLLLIGCSEFNLSNSPGHRGGAIPNITVEPRVLTFSELRKDEQEIQTFTIKNVGGVTLDVSNITVAAGDAFSVLSDPLAFPLEVGESTDIEVAFTPLATDNYGAIVVLSDDPDSPEVPVELVGTGAVPELVITPDHYNFEDAFIPCGSTVDLELWNVGKEDLTITKLGYTSGGHLSLDRRGLQLPVRLAPDESVYVGVDFAPSDQAADTGVLRVTSNDPRGVVEADQNGEGTYGEPLTETFHEPGIPPLDTMFLIDQSCSMAEDNKPDIRNGMPGFVAELRGTSDWQLIEVTEHTGCATGGIIDESTPNAEQLLIDHAFPPHGLFEDHREWEQLLKLADIALSKTGPGGCNEGFLRPGALLHIIVASDEKERSGFAAQYWINRYEDYVADPALLRISSIVDLNRNCGDESGPGAYRPAAENTGGELLNICTPNWGSQMTDLATTAITGVKTYNLSSSADEGSLLVEVNGVPTTGWTYSPVNNSVTVNDPPVGEGDVVEVTYAPGGDC